MNPHPHRDEGSRRVASHFELAAECLASAMTSEPGSADERRYMSAVQIFTRAASMQGGAA
jgi:hypothetical protein